MWADTSAWFTTNPEDQARNILRDGIDFAGRVGKMGMGENTHDATYRYFNMTRDVFKEYREIAAAHFFVNLMNEAAVSSILYRWIDCAVRACHTCMAPPGSSKYWRKPYVGPPSTEYIVHRQDQSVLGMLVYNWMDHHVGRVALNNGTYLSYENLRRDEAPNMQFLNSNI